MYIRRTAFSHLRCFEQGSVDLVYPGRTRERVDDPFAFAQEWPPTLPNVNLLLGDNGAGKTTVLKALALGALGRIMPQSGFVPFSLIRRLPDGAWQHHAAINADLELHDHDMPFSGPVAPVNGSVETIIERRGDREWIREPAPSGPASEHLWDLLYRDDSPAFFLVGYGATRRVEITESFDRGSRRKNRSPRYDRVASLFEDQLALTPLTAWLPELQRRDAAYHGRVLSLINKLLPAGTRLTAVLDDGEPIFDQRGVQVPFSALSDGFRAYLGWVGDLLYHLVEVCRPGMRLSAIPGVVLVDEIDLHIHPSWQRSIIPRVARTLPKLQFVLTSHSAIVCGTLEQPNLFRLRVREDGASIVERPDLELHGLSADQILTSTAFGLDSTRSPEFVESLRAISRRASSGEEGAAIELMRHLARGKAGTVDEPEDPPPWVQEAARHRRS